MRTRSLTMTINAYPDAHDGETLATQAHAVLENHKRYQAKVLQARSISRTEDRPSEYLISVVFTRAHFIEVAFARFMCSRIELNFLKQKQQ